MVIFKIHNRNSSIIEMTCYILDD